MHGSHVHQHLMYNYIGSDEDQQPVFKITQNTSKNQSWVTHITVIRLKNKIFFSKIVKMCSNKMYRCKKTKYRHFTGISYTMPAQRNFL